MVPSERIVLAALSIIVFCLDSVSGWSCHYIDSFGRYRYVYCPTSDCCGTLTHRYCCDYTPVGTIVGGVVGFLFLVAIIVTITTCFCCACCPVYQYRRGRSETVVVRSAPITAAPAPINYGATRPHVYPAAKPPPYSQQ